MILSGDGGDELFWGYPERFGSVLKNASDFRQPHWQRSARWAMQNRIGLGRNAHENLRWPSIGHWYRQKHTWFAPSVLASIFPVFPQWPEQFDLYDFTGWGQDETAQWLRRNEFIGHLAKVLLKVDRASMRHSLEVRVPLLDREVIDVATRVDWRSCLDLKTNTGKIPLRQSLQRHITHQTKAKRGFAVPIADWFRGPLQEVFIDRVLPRRELLGLVVEQPALEKLLADHVSGRVDNHRSLWALLSLALWHDRHFQPATVPVA